MEAPAGSTIVSSFNSGYGSVFTQQIFWTNFVVDLLNYVGSDGSAVRFFNGVNGRVNITADSSRQTEFRKKLVQWYGGALGCEQIFIPAVYTGPQLNLTLSHAALRIGARDTWYWMNAFEDTLNAYLLTLANANVSADPLKTAVASAITIHRSHFNEVAGRGVRPSLCDTYSDMWYTVVSTSANVYDFPYQPNLGPNWNFLEYLMRDSFFVSDILVDPLFRPYFNGSKTGGRNYITNSALLQQLVVKFVSYLGIATNCSDVDFAYLSSYPVNQSLPNLSNSHADLQIGSYEGGLFSDVLSAAFFDKGEGIILAAGGSILEQLGGPSWSKPAFSNATILFDDILVRATLQLGLVAAPPVSPPRGPPVRPAPQQAPDSVAPYDFVYPDEPTSFSSPSAAAAACPTLCIAALVAVLL